MFVDDQTREFFLVSAHDLLNVHEMVWLVSNPSNQVAEATRAEHLIILQSNLTLLTTNNFLKRS